MATGTYSPNTNDIIHQVDIDFSTRDTVSEKIHIVQYDKNLPVIEASMYKGIEVYAAPSGSTIKVRYEKPDRTFVYNDVLGLSSDRSKVYFAVSPQMAAAYGEASFIIEVTVSGKVAGSSAIDVIVERNPVQNDAIESTTEFPLLEDYVNQAKASADSAKASANTAGSHATNANTYKNQAETAKNNAAQSATNAKASETASKNSETIASTKANEATTKAAEADNYSQLSKSWAVGDTGKRPDEDTNCSEYFSQLAEKLVEEATKLLDQAQKIIAASTSGALIPAGTIPFEDLPASPPIGYMYNISNDFTTDYRFTEGAGIFYKAGANVYWTTTEEWDVMIGVQVTGVKGNKEENYRVGNVNLTPDNIGAVSSDGGDISNTTSTFEQADERSNITSEDTMSEALGKLSKMYADLEAGAGFYSTTDHLPNTDPATLPTAKAVSEAFDVVDISGKSISDNTPMNGVYAGSNIDEFNQLGYPSGVIWWIFVAVSADKTTKYCLASMLNYKTSITFKIVDSHVLDINTFSSQTINRDDMNNIPDVYTGFSNFYTESTVENSPNKGSNSGGFEIGARDWKAQLSLNLGLDAVSIRRKANGVWNEWKNIFGQSTGGFYASGDSILLSSSHDLNDFTDYHKQYYWAYGNQGFPAHAPNANDPCSMFSIKTAWGITQIAFPYDKSLMFLRSFYTYGSGWNHWTTIGNLSAGTIPDAVRIVVPYHHNDNTLTFTNPFPDNKVSVLVAGSIHIIGFLASSYDQKIHAITDGYSLEFPSSSAIRVKGTFPWYTNCLVIVTRTV